MGSTKNPEWSQNIRVTTYKIKNHYDVKKNRLSWIYIKWRILDLMNERKCLKFTDRCQTYNARGE